MLSGNVSVLGGHLQQSGVLHVLDTGKYGPRCSFCGEQWLIVFTF